MLCCHCQPQWCAEVYKPMLGKGAYLRSEAGAGVHDERPEVMAAGNRGDVEAVIIALLYMLVHARVGHVVVVALLHRPVRVVHGNPLCRRQPQPDLLFGDLQTTGDNFEVIPQRSINWAG